jgi:hypothetical protein
MRFVLKKGGYIGTNSSLILFTNIFSLLSRVPDLQPTHSRTPPPLG